MSFSLTNTGFFTLMKNKPFFFFVFTFALLTIMHIHVFNRDLVGVHVWRQTQTQINIENFAYNDFNIFHPKSYTLHNKNFDARYEFPIMQWVFAIFYKLFGSSIIISRALTFVISIFTAVGMYKLLGSVFSNKNIPIIGTWCFCFSPVLYYYMVNPLPDNFALCVAVWSLHYFFQYQKHPTNKYMFLSFMFLSLATLNKLPFVLYATPWLVFFVVTSNSKLKLSVLQGLSLLLFLAPAIIWYVTVIPGWTGNGVVSGIAGNTKTNVSDLLYIMQSNLISTLPELLLNYGSTLFFLVGIFLFFKLKLFKNKTGLYLGSLGLALIAYFLFEMNMIGTVHDYYLFPFLPLLFILVAYGAKKILESNLPTLRVFATSLIFILPLTAFLRINERWNTESPGFNRDLLVYKHQLASAVPDNAYCISGNDKSAHIWPYYLHKKTWSFYEDSIDENTFQYYCKEGAQFLYSDSRKLEELPFVKAHIKRLVLTKGSINVFELSR